MGLRSRFADVRTMRRLFEDAERIATDAGEDPPGAEHLLLAALALPEGSGRRALDAVGITPEAFAEAVRAQHREALRGLGLDALDASLDQTLASRPRESGPTRGPFRSRASFSTLFVEVQARVRRARSQLLGAWFVLVAVQQAAEGGTVARTLATLDVDLGALGAAALAELPDRTA